jgi:hypothetical protein
MKRVTGIGGIFFSAKDPVALRAWYQKHLGIDVQPWGGAAFTWTDPAGQPTTGTTIWSIGKDDGKHFAPSTSSFMVNYRVENLAALLAALREEGCNVLEKTDDPSTASSAGSSTPKATKSNSGSRRRGNSLTGVRLRRVPRFGTPSRGTRAECLALNRRESTLDRVPRPGYKSWHQAGTEITLRRRNALIHVDRNPDYRCARLLWGFVQRGPWNASSVESRGVRIAACAESYLARSLRGGVPVSVRA